MRVLVLLFLASAVFAKNEEYSGWKSYFVEPSSQEQLEAVGSMLQPFELDFLSYPSVNHEGLILVKPQFQEVFTRALEHYGVKYGIHCTNIKEALDSDDKLIAQKQSRQGRSLPYDNYHRADVIDQYLKDVAAKYPDRVTLVNPGNTFLGRPVYYLKISTSNFSNPRKPIIFIEGGTHAREWISPPTVTWAIHKLVENVTEPDLLDNFDWILFPLVNPDGYEFSFTQNRFWRKTRSNDTHSLSNLCPGADINRNFAYQWMTIGASSFPCQDNYAGNRPFSEIETRHVNDIFINNLGRMSMYLSMHSYGSMVLYPWSHNATLPVNGLPLHSVSVAMADAINSVTRFTPYRAGNSALVVGYRASGVSADHALSLGVPFSIIYELPGFSSNLQGFVVSPELIDPIVRETWTGIVAGARRLSQFF